MCAAERGIAILRDVKNHRSRQPSRHLVRRVVLAVITSVVAVVALPAVASADTPAAWKDAPDVSGLQFLVVLLLIPAGLALLISLLAVLPSIIRDSGYAPGQSWRAEAEWFGGPQKGIEAAADLSPQQLEAAETGRGGTSAQW